MTDENQRTHIYASAGWLMLAKIVGFVFSLFLPLLVVRILNKSEAGIYQQVFLVITTVSGILPFGLSMSAYYFLSREKENARFYIFNILFFNLVVGAIACFTLWFYPELLGKIFKDGELVQYAPKMGFVIWFWIFSAFLETVAVANQEARLATVFIILAQFTKSFFMVLAITVFGTVEAMLNAAMIQVLLQTVILFIYLNSRFKDFWKSFDFGFFVKHLKYALPFGFAGLLWILQTDLHNYFVGYRFSSADVAVYRAGCFELPLLGLLYESISSVLIPKMSELESQGRKTEMIELTAAAMCKVSMFYFPVFVFFLITAETFITTLFTENYADSVPIFLVNILLLPTYVVVTDPLVRSYASLGKYILKVRIFIVLGLFAFLTIGINYFDLRTMILIVVITSVIDRLVTSVKIGKIVGVTFDDVYLLKNVGLTAVVSLAAGVFTYLVYTSAKVFLPTGYERLSHIMKPGLAHFIAGSLVLGVSAVTLGIVFLIGANYFNLIDESEREIVINKLTRIKQIFGLSQDARVKTHT